MKVLLANPNVLTPEVFPAGMEYTAEHLIREGRHDVSVLDMNVSDDIEAAVRDQDLVLMGVRNIDSGMDNEAPELPLVRSIIERFRQVYDGPIGIAGSAVNLVPDAVRNYLDVEYALVSKGFGAVDQLLDHLEAQGRAPATIREYSRSVDGRFHRNVIDKAFYLRDGGRIGVATKFGCPFRCQHCDYPAIDGRVQTMRPPPEVVDEVRSLHHAGIQKIFFADAQFNIPVKHGIAVLEGMLDAGLDDVDWDGFINPHRAAFNERLAQLFKRFGKTQVHFGVDSLSEPVLRDLRKGFTVEHVRNAVRMCRELGMEVSCSVLFGSPSETTETVRETFSNIDDIGFTYVDVSPRIRIYPETPLYDIAVQQGIVTAGDPLLHPFFYPVSREVVELVYELSDDRPECHPAGLIQYFSFDETHLPTESLGQRALPADLEPQLSTAAAPPADPVLLSGGASASRGNAVPVTIGGRGASSDLTATRVKGVMVRTLDLATPAEQIRDDQSLYTSVIGLDSLGLLQVLMALEAEFGCHIEDEDVMAADLTDVSSLVQLVQDKVAG